MDHGAAFLLWTLCWLLSMISDHVNMISGYFNYLTPSGDQQSLEWLVQNIFGGKQDEISILTVSISVIVTHSRCTFLGPNG